MKKSFDPDLNRVGEKVIAGERLTFEDGLVLEKTFDLLALGQLANVVRERLNGNNTYYINNPTSTTPTSASTRASSARSPARRGTRTAIRCG